MGASLDYKIQVNILSSAPLVGAANFTIPLLISEGATFAAVLVKSYNSAADITADSELDAGLKLFASQFFAQKVHPGALKIGKIPAVTTYSDALDAIFAEDSAFYCVITDDRTGTHALEVANWVDTNKRLAVVQLSDSTIPPATGGNDLEDLVTPGKSRTLAFYHLAPLDAEALDLALAAHKLAADPDNVSTTWANTPLVGITAEVLTSTERDAIIDGGGNVYLPFGGVPATSPGKSVDGTFFDIFVAGDWLAARVGEGLAQLLMDVSARNSKIPYTQAGLAQAASVPRKWLKRGEAIGHFRPGSSTVVVSAIEDIPDATVRSRVATITAETTLAGAIDQTITVNIAVLEA